MAYDGLRRSGVWTVFLDKSYDGLGRDYIYYAPALSLYDIPSGLVGNPTPNSTYGLTAIQAVYGYGTVSFQYITNQSSAVSAVSFFASVRQESALGGSPNIGFSSSGRTGGCAQIFCEELLN